MNPIPLIEEFIGRSLNEQSAAELAEAPGAEIARLMKTLESFYFDWLEIAEQENAAKAAGCFFCIDPTPKPEDWIKHLAYYKRCLLYMPRLAISDPLSSVLKPAFTAAELLGSFPDTATFRQELRGSLQFLAALSKPAKTADVVLIPWDFAVDYSSVQDAVRKEIDSIDLTSLTDQYYPPIMEAIEDLCQGMPADQRNDDLIRKIFVGQAKVAGHLSTRLMLTLVAGNELTRTILQQEYRLHQGLAPRQAGAVHQVTAALTRYQIPPVDAADMQTIMSIRENETACRISLVEDQAISWVGDHPIS